MIIIILYYSYNYNWNVISSTNLDSHNIVDSEDVENTMYIFQITNQFFI